MLLRVLGWVLLTLLFTIAAEPLVLAQPRDETELKALNNRVVTLYRAGKYYDAFPLAKRYAAAMKALHGENSPEYAKAINNLAQLLQDTNRLSEAEPLMRQALAIDEKSYGPDHPKVAFRLNNLAALLHNTNRLSEAEPLMRRALAIDEKNHGPDHPDVARDLNNLAQLLKATNRLSKAEPLMRREIAIFEKAYGPEHPNVATALNNLAQLLKALNRLSDAEPLMRRALAIDEKNHGPEHPNVATSLNNLAQLLADTNRPSEAEPLMRRALAINEKSYGPGHPNVATSLNNLAALLTATNRLSEAEPLMRRALAIDEKSYGPDHPDVAIRLNNLAQLLKATNRLSKAEPLMRRVIAIFEKAYGPEHPNVATSLSNLAALLKATNRLSEAELLMRRVIAIFERAYGSEHPDVAISLNNLTWLHEQRNDWSTAATLCLRTKPNMIGADASRQTGSGVLSKARLAQKTERLRNCARVLYHANKDANRSEGFALAQWAMQNAAADALTLMSARFARGDAELAKRVREQQDLLKARTDAYRRLDVAAGKADAKAAAATRAAIAKIKAQLAAAQKKLRREFPEYAALANPQPLSLAETQALLSDDQALVMFLDMWQVGKVPEETLVFALTRKEARWLSIPLGTRALWERVTALRCGLDSSNWRQGEKSRDICKKLLNTEVAEDAQPPFDARMAHALYHDLFGGIKDLIRGKTLLIVPSGPLTQLPFEVLVTAEPDKKLPRFEVYKNAAWLGERQAITVLPSVGSVKALRAAKSSKATTPFIGFGNPLLTGRNGTDESAWAKQSCRDATEPQQTHVAGLLGNFLSLFRGGVVNVEALRKQPPLPETADELCAVASDLGVTAAESDKTVYLGKRATVSRVKALSADGKLARARVVHFATYGLLAGETKLFAQTRAEPALLLTPPAKASKEDNGLLTTSEVAQLKLDADWVILSASNTAAGEGKSAEAVSGLARAFFYAGGRSLLVSHWPVNSKAAVELTTGAIKEMKANPKIGRAEALRRSISAFIARGNGRDHPSIWAPFVLVGNGGQ